MTETIRFHRVGPWDVPVQEEIQILYLKSLGNFSENYGLTFDQLVSRVNVNIDYSGMKFTTLVDSKETELLTNAINGLATSPYLNLLWRLLITFFNCSSLDNGAAIF